MKKTILAALALAATLGASAQTEVLRIELTDGTTQTIAVEKIKEMTFGEENKPSAAELLAGSYTGTNTVTVGGNFTYTAECQCEITANPDGTVDFTWEPYSLKETVMGDLTLGTCTISNIAWDEAQGGFYRDYSADGITQHFTAEKDGVTSMDKDYVLGETSTILIQPTADGITVTNPFKLGAMPLPLTSTFEGKK